MMIADKPQPESEELGGDPDRIFRAEEYRDGRGKMVTVQHWLDGVDPTYVGQATGTRKVRTPQGNVTQPVPFMFEIKAGTLEEAFAVYEAQAKARWPEIVAEIQKMEQMAANRIQLPGGIPPSRLNFVAPGGNGRRKR